MGGHTACKSGKLGVCELESSEPNFNAFWVCFLLASPLTLSGQAQLSWVKKRQDKWSSAAHITFTLAHSQGAKG